MNAHQGYYSVLQYCPDLGKFEAANIGVLLFCPETGFLKGVTTRTNQRVAHFFGREHDTKKLNSLKRGIVERLANEEGRIKTVEDLKRFIALRANQVQITPPRSIRVEDPERDLAALFEEVIGEAPKAEEKKSLRKLLIERAIGAGLGDLVEQKVSIDVPKFGKTIEYPLGYQNGVYNVIRDAQFQSQSSDQSVGTACKYAVEAEAIHGLNDTVRGRMQLVLVADFRRDGETEGRVRSVFEGYPLTVFDVKDELPNLFDTIRRTAKPVADRRK
jgi:hypothetical protein